MESERAARRGARVELLYCEEGRRLAVAPHTSDETIRNMSLTRENVTVLDAGGTPALTHTETGSKFCRVGLGWG